MPNFLAPYLHIDEAIPTDLEGGATTLAEVTSDFDGEARHATTPDIGADEFILTGIDQQTTIPVEFVLAQNYPNPANPSTTIEFDLPKSSQVTLKVFNILGEEVATLVSGQLAAGKYTYDWDGSNVASGVYLYRIEAEGFVQTRKMILMR
jgi:hypothetical protein